MRCRERDPWPAAPAPRRPVSTATSCAPPSWRRSRPRSNAGSTAGKQQARPSGPIREGTLLPEQRRQECASWRCNRRTGFRSQCAYPKDQHGTPAECRVSTVWVQRMNRALRIEIETATLADARDRSWKSAQLARFGQVIPAGSESRQPVPRNQDSQRRRMRQRRGRRRSCGRPAVDAMAQGGFGVGCPGYANRLYAGSDGLKRPHRRSGAAALAGQVDCSKTAARTLSVRGRAGGVGYRLAERCAHAACRGHRDRAA